MDLRRGPAALALCALAALGCAGGGGAAGTGGTPAGSGGSGGSPGSGGGSGGTGASPGTGGGTLFGTIDVELVPEDDANFVTAHGSLAASLYDAAAVASLTAREDMDGCTLLVPVVAACDPACGSSMVCTGQGQCAPKPALQNVGTLHVTGLQTSSGTSFDVTPSKSNAYMSATLPYPPCDEGDAVGVQGDSFSVSGKCIAPLAVTSSLPIPLVDAQKNPIAGTVTWTPPAQAGISRVQMLLEISHHDNGSKGQINCDVPDTGSFSIPQKLVADLIALGRAGYPTIEVSRVSTATPGGQPGVQLLVRSAWQLDVDTGVVSCGGGGDTGTDSCPSGTTCSDGPPYLCQ